MNRQHVTLLVLSDLLVDHNIPIQRLTTTFGMIGLVFNWFKSYLEGRAQHVSVQGSVSDKFDLKWAVPQGSCLGLYCLYYAQVNFSMY